MKKLFIIFALFFVGPLYAQKKKAEKIADPLAGIEKELEQILKDRKAAGFAVAVVRKDSVIYAKGFGYRDYENKLPVTPNTLFAIGSCTKAFTASLLGLMNKEGKLDFNTPARDYLPGLKFFNDDLTRNVTVKDLMVHRTGLPRHDLSWYLFSTDSREELLGRIAYMEPTAPLRQTWQYNNFMYLVQGMIAEKHYGKTWEEVLSERLLKPMGMRRSNSSIAALTADSDAALGYELENDSLISKRDYYHINAMGPAGSINSSVMEMARWLKVWINKGKLNGREILPESYINEAISSQMVVSALLPQAESPDVHLSNYGYGWILNSYRGHYRVDHGGNIDGFSANTAFYPADSIGIVVLTNQNASSLNSVVRNTLADRLLGLKPVDWNGRMNKAQAKSASGTAGEENRKKGTQPSHPLKDYEGVYTHKAYGTFEVKYQNDSLIAVFPLEKMWLRHYHYDVFQSVGYDKSGRVDTTEIFDVLVPFYMNEAGDIVSAKLQLQAGLESLTFTKAGLSKEVSENDLRVFEGEYQLAPQAIARVYIKNQKLHLFIAGQPEYELLPVGDRKFEIKSLAGYTLEFEGKEERVESVKFIQPNGIFKANKVK
ncbi:MAG: serine hydrolase [Leadbetterella sp.]|nr:serine hydrolase [Leadbetterella sp.]